MKKDIKKKLQALDTSLSKIGSGLDAIDKTGDNSYYLTHQKQSQKLLDSLPKEVQKKLSSSKPGMHNWYKLQAEVRKLQE